PPYLPDHPAIRQDWATYLDQIEAADAQVGEILDRLETEGVADNTVVVFIGDNGRCVHRGKGFLYEDGIKVPCLMRWPAGIEAGQQSSELISMIDVSAQILAFAGIEVPDYLQGRALLERSAQERKYVFAARDRWDEVFDKSRAIIGRRYKYIRNDMPEVPYFTYHSYLERVRPIRPVLWKLFQAGKMTPPQAHLMQPTKPREELYDLEVDPWETVNLATETDYTEVLQKLRAKLQQWEIETADQGRQPEPESAIDGKTRERISNRKRYLAEHNRQ
ncbi:MAG: sulfatase-like hydrolase/transferase, partial [Pirellulales bacterium]|nr:sulfatase-like hydrolase/transferase [Pirellulales bacterium]